jgi:hypothetical protein
MVNELRILALRVEEDARRVVLLDPKTTRIIREYGPSRGATPVWSLDGRSFAFESGGDAWIVHHDDLNQPFRFASDVLATIRRPFAFSPAGDWLAAGTTEGVRLYAVRSREVIGKPLRIPDGLIVESLAFSVRDEVAAMSRAANGETYLVRINTRSAATKVVAVEHELMEFRADGSLMLKAIYEEARNREASQLGIDDLLMPHYFAPEDRFIDSYLPVPDLFVLGTYVEDTGDETPYWVVSADGGEPRRLIAGLRQVQDLNFSPDGRWGAFLHVLEDEFVLAIVDVDRGEHTTFALENFIRLSPCVIK